MKDIIFNPFGSSKLHWNLYVPGRFIGDINIQESYCLMLDKKTGRVYMKCMRDVTHCEFAQVSGHDAVVAYASEKDCFD